MHQIAIILLIIVILYIIFNKEKFIASYDMMINRSLNPIWARYHGREKNPWGEDYYELFFKRQMMDEYSKLNAKNITMFS